MSPPGALRTPAPPQRTAMFGTARPAAPTPGIDDVDEVEELDAELAELEDSQDAGRETDVGAAVAALVADAAAPGPTQLTEAAPASAPAQQLDEKTQVTTRANSVRPASPGAYGMSDRSRGARPPSDPPASTAETASPLDRELRARVERLKGDDPIGAARAMLELGLLSEWLVNDRDRAKKHYESARAMSRTLGPALTRLRRAVASQAALSGMQSVGRELLQVLEEELVVAETNESRADLLAARARVFEVTGDLQKARHAYGQALELTPKHAPSLHGLEVVLRRDLDGEGKSSYKDLADHLGRLAEVYLPDGADGDAALAAWICVERAEILEKHLKDTAAARESLKRAVALAPQPGPIRNALVRHLCRNDRDAGLAEALRVEAERETDADRASRLLYASARISLDRVGARGDGMASLGRAEQRALAGSLTQERVLAELVSQLDGDGDHARLVEVRVKRLALLKTQDAIAFEYVRLSESYGRVGRPDLAADAAARALAQDPANRPAREILDLTLQRLGKHADRVRAWLGEASSDIPLRARVAAFTKAADIARRNLGQADQAIEALRAAWLIDPGNARVFDALAVLLRPERERDEASVRNAEARIDLYEQASQIESDRERKIGYLEKALSIWEDELERPEKAVELADRVLAIDPRRRSAVVALERCARRANDVDRLLRALESESKVAEVPGLRVRLLLEAAEITERQSDRDRALSFIDRALEADPNDSDAIRAKVALLKRMGRGDEARRSLASLVEHDPEAAYDIWLEIADLDETVRRAPGDAVEAYRNAHRARPAHPLPLISMGRLLRTTKNYKRLVSELKTLARTTDDPRSLSQLYVTSAEVQELNLGEDEDALQSLEAADAVLWGGAEPTFDPTLFESAERILFRLGSDERLTRHYAKWLERKPPATIDHTLRVALAGSLESVSAQQAAEVLEGLVQVVPTHLPALRRLEHLSRSRKNFQSLQATLYAETAFITSRLARGGALWEVAGLEDRVGATTTLDALARVVREFPQDTGALDTLVRVASRILSAGSATPHLAAARAHLLAALRARRELSIDPMGRAAYLLEEAMLHESGEERDLAASLTAYKEALSLWPDSLLAAKGVERLASHLGDNEGVIASQLALAKLVDDGPTKAAHFVRAAELTHQHTRDERTALELYQVALECDAESKQAARAIVTMLANDPRRALEIARPAIDRARSRDQVILLGTEIATAYLKIFQKEGEAAQLDYGPGIAALQRALKFAPDDIGGLFTLARLYIAQKAYAEARGTLQRIVEIAGNTDSKTRLLALFSLVDLYEGPLSDLALAESTLVTVLSAEPTNKTALERLYGVATKSGDKALARSALERLAESETDLAQRTEYLLRVAEAYREANDGAGLLRSLTDAVVSTPADIRPWTLLCRCYRTDTQDGAAGLARSIEQIIEMAKGRRRPVEARWLFTLGLLELNMLKRITEGIGHLQTAVTVASAPGAQAGIVPEVRAGLGAGLLAAGRNKEAVQILRDLVSTDAETLLRLAEPGSFVTVRNASVAPTGPVLGAVLSCLDAALSTEGRAEECVPVEEVRAVMGDLAGERLAKLRARRLEVEVPYANAYAGSELSRALVPEARTPVVDVAIAIQPISAKALRFELATLGVSSRDRIGPRDGHPTRHLADRIARCLGVPDFELYLTPSWSGAIRVYPGDPPALVGPVGLAELPEGEQMFALARLLTRVALGTTWLDEISIEVADALLVASVRSVMPQFGLGEVVGAREHAVNQLLPSVQRAIGRRQRRAIEDLAPTLSAGFDFRTISIALRRSEYRAAYVLSGDLLGSLEYLKRVDADIGRGVENPRVLLQHPVTSELIRYALTSDSFAERRRVGTIWTAARSSSG